MEETQEMREPEAAARAGGNRIQQKKKSTGNRESAGSKVVLYGLAVLQSIVWGFSFLGTKTALAVLIPIEIVAIRWTIAATVLVLLTVVGVIKVNFKGKNLKPLIGAVILQPCIYSVCEAYGVSLTTTSESSILVAMGPVVVVLLSVVFLKEKISAASAGAVVMAFVGVIIAISTNESFSLGGKSLGYLIMGIGVVTCSFFTIASNRLSRTFAPMEITLVMTVQGSIFFNAIVFLFGRGPSIYRICFSDFQTAAAVLFLGLGCTFFCYMVFNLVVAKLPAHVASALQLNLVTLTGVLSGILCNGDPWNIYTVIGLVIMLTGVVLSNRAQKDSGQK